jgi:hypothetical protein
MINSLGNNAVSSAIAAEAYRQTQEQNIPLPAGAIRPADSAGRLRENEMNTARRDLPGTGERADTKNARADTAASRKALAEASFTQAGTNALKIRTEKQLGVQACETCSSRRYVDGSTDPGVSFKSPGHISPEASMAAVSSHEQEHVSNAKARASAENKEIVSQSVSLHMDKCPECGKSYVSGGTTTTVTRTVPQKSEPVSGTAAVNAAVAAAQPAGDTANIDTTADVPAAVNAASTDAISAKKNQFAAAYKAHTTMNKNRAGQLLDIAA